MKVLALFCATIFGLLNFSTAMAKDATDLCGEYTSVDVDEKVIDMGNNIKLVAFRSTTQMNAADGSKYNQLTGQCTGGAVMYPDLTIEAEGLCVVTDVDGDILTYIFSQGRPDRQGRFVRKGGTGKFIDAKDTGWYAPVSMNGELTVGNWGGPSACK